MPATDEEQPDEFEFEVADVATLQRYGTFPVGWIRRGTVRVGDRVMVLGAGTPVVAKVWGVGSLSGPGPKSGGPNVQLLLDNDDAISELAPGVRIVAAPPEQA